ncbi:Imm53 family immunity protein [Chryseobacterium lineare]
MIDWLQKWFKEQTDGNWEHEVIIKIESIDNPGWSIEIDLMKSDIIPIEWRLFEISDDNWLGYKFEDNIFYIAGDASKLDLSIRVFQEFIEKGSIEENFILERMQ